MRLKFIAVLHETGIPIYSRCFNKYCKSLKQSSKKLDSFLHAVSTLPSLIDSKNETDKHLFLEDSILFYHESADNEFIYLTVFSDSLNINSICEDLNRMFTNFSQLFNSNFYEKLAWEEVKSTSINQIGHNIENRILKPWFSRAHIDVCWEQKQNCMLQVTSCKDERKNKFWDAVKASYAMLEKN